MAKEKEAEAVEVKKAEKPKVDQKAFAKRKLKAINALNNAFIAERLAEQIKEV